VNAHGPVRGEGDEPAVAEDNSLARLLALSDGVFAIAITLLVLDLRVPDLPEGADQAALLAALQEQLPNLVTYLLSFYVVGSYWLAHRRIMRTITRAHPRLISHTLTLLFVVAVLPFPSGLLARYVELPIALALYAIVNIVANIALLRLGRDLRKYELTATPRDDRRAEWEQYGDIGVFLICIVAGFLFP
jgi:uncharacterized membrane protein